MIEVDALYDNDIDVNCLTSRLRGVVERISDHVANGNEDTLIEYCYSKDCDCAVKRDYPSKIAMMIFGLGFEKGKRMVRIRSYNAPSNEDGLIYELSFPWESFSAKSLSEILKQEND